jgi:hypothetical protein
VSAICTIERTRLGAAGVLANALRAAQGDFSEQGLRDAWRAELRADPALHEDGWYDPPPGGLIVWVAKAQDGFTRAHTTSFRPETAWPGPTRYAPGDVLYAYASPVDRASALIGDFGLSLYNGPDPAVRRHALEVLEVTLATARAAEPGMPMRDLHAHAMELARVRGLTNAIESLSGPAGTNIGHTVPWSCASDGPAPAHLPFPALREAIRAGRRFLSPVEAWPLPQTVAFTVEPRLSAPGLPQMWFHFTVLMEGGRKRLASGFAPVLAAFGGMEEVRERLAAWREGEG